MQTRHVWLACLLVCFLMGNANRCFGIGYQEFPCEDPPDSVLQRSYVPLPDAVQDSLELLYPEFSSNFTIEVDWDVEDYYSEWPWSRKLPLIADIL